MTHNALARLTDASLSTTPAEQARDDYRSHARSDNTRRGYASDWRHWLAWCDSRSFTPLPAHPETVSLYLSDMAQQGYRAATIGRHLSSIAVAHRTAGIDPPPTSSAAVRFTLAGIRRVHGTAQEGKAPALVDDVQAMVAAMKPRRGKPWRLLLLRDRALLLLGFSSAFRRSELVALNVEDLEFVRAGVVVHQRRSKTDQEGRGRRIGIPRGAHDETCPVRALRAYLQACGDPETGPVFRSVNRWHQLGDRLSDRGVALVVKRWARAAGLDPARYAGHSLRSGFATSAIKAGVSEMRAMAQTGHKSQTVFRRYVKSAELFDGELGKIGL